MYRPPHPYYYGRPAPWMVRPPPPRNYSEDDFDNRAFWDFEQNPAPVPQPNNFVQNEPVSLDHSPGIRAQTPRRNGAQPPHNRGQKRKVQEANLPVDNSFKARLARIYTETKNCVSILNEMKVPQSAFVFGDMIGPSHAPIFQCSVTVEGVTYTASATSKKAAKDSAARTAIQAILSEPGNADGEAEFPILEREKTPVYHDDHEDPASTHNGTYEPLQNVHRAEATLAPEHAVMENHHLPASASAKPPSPTATPTPAADAIPVLNNVFREPMTPTDLGTLEKLSAKLRNFSPAKLEDFRKLMTLIKELRKPEESIQLCTRILNAFHEPHTFLEEPCHSTHAGMKQFRYKLLFLDETFIGICTNKAGAKRKVAEHFLTWLLDVISMAWQRLRLPETFAQSDPAITDTDEATRQFVAQITLKFFEKLTEIKLACAGSQLYGFIDDDHMVSVVMFKEGQPVLVSFACGSSVIHRKNLSSKGKSLKDSQAEVLAIRAAKLYVLKEIGRFYTQQESIFSLNASGLLELKPDISFHLYLSRLPSGTCYASSKNAENFDKNRLSCIVGQFADQNLQQYPADEQIENNYEEIIAGRQKLHIMSASDKLMRNTVVGFQGALASCLGAKPIFFDTVTLGGKETPDLVSLGEGLFHRILPFVSASKQTVGDCKIYCPELCVAEAFPSDFDQFSLRPKTAQKSVVWCIEGLTSDPLVEFLDTDSGPTVDGKQSVLCKRSFGNICAEIITKMSSKETLPESIRNRNPEEQLQYRTLKCGSELYQKRMNYFKEILKESRHGLWVSKCSEEEEFAVDFQTATSGSGDA